MLKLLYAMLMDESGEILAITYAFSANTLISSSQMNTNMDDIVAVVNALTSANYADDSVGKAALASDVVRAAYGLIQYSDGSLYVDVSDTTPGLELTDGGLRVKVDGSSIERAAGGIQVKINGITAAMLVDNLVFDQFPSTPSATPDADYEVANKKYVDDTVGASGAMLLTGDQTAAGIKTFTSSPIVPTPTTDMQASTKKYVDDNAVFLTGAQSVAGVKTFSSSPVVPTPTTATQAANKAYVDAAEQLLHVRDEKAANTAGGTFTLGDWRTRTLNSEKTNEITGASLASNQITLPAGTYFIEATAPADHVSFHVLKLRNISDGSDQIIGTTGASSAGGYQTISIVKGRFTITGEKVFEMQHRCTETNATTGLGRAVNVGVVEVYSEVVIRKINS